MNTCRGIRRIAFRPLGVIVGVVGFVSIGATHVMAADYGVANDTNQAIVFDASTLATVATIPLTGTNFGVTVMPNQSLAFVSRGNDIYVIDLTQHPPSLAAGVNPIANPIGTIVEDLSLTADGRFLVVTDTSGGSPMGVINTATRTVVGTFTFLPDHTSVDVCEHGSVLVTSVTSSVVKRLTISAAGTLVDTGQSLALSSAEPNGVTCARGGTTGVVVNRLTGDLRSFLVNGMTLVSTQVLPGTGGTNYGINVSISSDGTKIFGRRANDFITAYNFNSTTGIIGAQLWSTNVGARPTFFGVKQMALSPTGHLLFASTANFVQALNTSTGAVTGGVSILNPTGVALRRTAFGPGDLNGDGAADLVWRQTQTGDVAAWLMNGAGVTQQSIVASGIPLAWQIVGIGDVDGDGNADLVWRQTQTGDVAVWLMNGAAVRQASIVASGVPLAWQIVGIGDLNGDGDADLVWRQTQTGDVAAWLMNGAAVTQATVVAAGVPLAWQIVEVGDLDGDGDADLVWRQTQTGDVAVWLMNGAAVTQESIAASGVPLAWQIVGIGDLDGDGAADLVWRQTQTGDVAVWLMNGAAVTQATVVAAGVPLAWQIVEVGDLDGDGAADLVWRQTQTGDVAAWLMNGVTVTQQSIVAPGVPLPWQIQQLQ